MSARKSIRLATIEGLPVTPAGKVRKSRGATQYEKRQWAIREAEHLVCQCERVKAVVEALGNVVHRPYDAILVHALWRDLACETGHLPQMGRNILRYLDVPCP